MTRIKNQPKAPPEPKAKRWTRKEYYRLYQLGFFRGRRVELIEGEIVEMPPMLNPHAVAVSLALDALRAAFGAGYWVRPQLPLHLETNTEPEPDVSVVSGGARDYQDHPTMALLALEISYTSLRFDRERKGNVYARAGIADYWIVNLVDGELEIYRDPQPDPMRPGCSKYGTITILKAGDSVAPLAAANSRIAVSDLFP